MTTNWTKCSERMPPDDDSEIFIRKLNCSEWQQTPANEIWLDIDPDELYHWEWIPYDEETWKMLNREKIKMKHEIEIPDLPEGWEPVAYKVPEAGEYYFGSGGIKLAHINFDNLWLVVRKKQPLRGLHDPLRFAEGLIEQLPDDHEGAINWLMNHGEGDKAGKLRKKYSHPQTRRIVLESTGNIRQSCYLLKIDDGNLVLPPGREYKIADDKNETRD